MKDIFKTIIKDFHTSKLKDTKKRRIELPIGSNAIISVIGVRRSGKTFLLFETIKRLLASNVPIEKILYINFEDERLDLRAKDLDLLLQSYLELYPQNDLKSCYFFFDEIQNVNGWEKFIRRVFDTINTNIFITGSNSKLLSTDIATSLRGRTMTFTIYPLDFREYINFKNIDTDYYGSKQKAELFNSYMEFLQYGGFPEILELPQSLKIRRLQNYFDTIIYKDLIERYQIKHPLVLKYFIKKIFNQITKPLSVNKIYNDLKSQGYKISNNMLYEYLEYIKTTFTALLIPKFDFSEIKQLKSDKKAYSIDNGLLTATNFSFSKNYGALFENMLALEFLKYEKQIYYYKNVYECDFVVQNGNDYRPVQASYSLQQQETFDREIKGLIKACEYFKVKQGFIITNDYEDNMSKNGISIQFVPAYKFMIDIKKYF